MKKRAFYLITLLFFTIFVLYHAYPLMVSQPNNQQPMYKGDHVFFNRGTEVRASDVAGRGLFATRFFRKGEIVERAPLLVYKEPDDYVNTLIDDYNMNVDDDLTGMALGYVSYANHSENNNVMFDVHGDEQYVDYIAVRDIYPGEEIFSHYGVNYWKHRTSNNNLNS